MSTFIYLNHVFSSSFQAKCVACYFFGSWSALLQFWLAFWPLIRSEATHAAYELDVVVLTLAIATGLRAANSEKFVVFPSEAHVFHQQTEVSGLAVFTR